MCRWKALTDGVCGVACRIIERNPSNIEKIASGDVEAVDRPVLYVQVFDPGTNHFAEDDEMIGPRYQD